MRVQVIPGDFLDSASHESALKRALFLGYPVLTYETAIPDVRMVKLAIRIFAAL